MKLHSPAGRRLRPRPRRLRSWWRRVPTQDKSDVCLGVATVSFLSCAVFTTAAAMGIVNRNAGYWTAAILLAAFFVAVYKSGAWKKRTRKEDHHAKRASLSRKI